MHKVPNPCIFQCGSCFFCQGGFRLLVLFLLQNTVRYSKVYHAPRPLTNSILSRFLVPHFPISVHILSLTLPLPCPPPLTSLIPTMFCGFSQHVCLWCTLITLFWSLIPPLLSLTSPHWHLIRPRNGQDYCTRTGPTIPQKDRWSLHVPPFLHLKRWCLVCIAPLYQE